MQHIMAEMQQDQTIDGALARHFVYFTYKPPKWAAIVNTVSESEITAIGSEVALPEYNADELFRNGYAKYPMVDAIRMPTDVFVIRGLAIGDRVGLNDYLVMQGDSYIRRWCLIKD